MKTDKPKNNNTADAKKDASEKETPEKVREDLTLTGPNTELLSVRISKGLYRELEHLAKTSKRQFPEVLREMLWFHAFPSNLQSRLRELKENSAQRPNEAALFTLSLSPQLAMYQHQVDRLLESCRAVRKIETQALALKTTLERLEEEAKAGWQDFLDSTTAQ